METGGSAGRNVGEECRAQVQLGGNPRGQLGVGLAGWYETDARAASRSRNRAGPAAKRARARSGPAGPGAHSMYLVMASSLLKPCQESERDRSRGLVWAAQITSGACQSSQGPAHRSPPTKPNSCACCRRRLQPRCAPPVTLPSSTDQGRPALLRSPFLLSHASHFFRPLGSRMPGLAVQWFWQGGNKG
jgi:hypothetical protein